MTDETLLQLLAVNGENELVPRAGELERDRIYTSRLVLIGLK